MKKKMQKIVEETAINSIETATTEFTADQLQELLQEQKRINTQLKLHRAEIAAKTATEINERKLKRINNFTSWNVQRVKHYQKSMNCLKSDYLIEYSVDAKKVDESRMSAELGSIYTIGGTIRIVGKKPAVIAKTVDKVDTANN